MTTSYSLTDQLSKDSGGQKILMPVDISTSQLDFSLMFAIGVSTVQSKRVGSLSVGGGMVASVIQPGAVGMPGLLAYFAAPSNIAAGGFQLARGNSKGHQFVTYASMIASVMSGSTETASAASGLLYSIGVIAPSGGALAGGCVIFLDGATSKWIVSLSNNNYNHAVNFGPRGIGCATSIRYEKRGIPAAAIPETIVMVALANDVNE